MLPVKLKMQAFASYAEAVEIDFEKLNNLFLIHGDTGSGKTAILDAMMYALYGKSSGDGRSTFRCVLPVAKDLNTEVEFTFRSGGELYKFTRTITKDDKKKQNCFIFDKTEGIFRALLSNPNATNVNDEAEKITGFEADQFRQVVILPQGQFEKLLTSSSKEKEDTFSTLFDSEKYTNISDNLYKRSKKMEKDIEKDEKALQAVLATVNAESISMLEKMTEEKESEMDTLFPQIEEAEKVMEKTRNRLTDAEVTAEKFRSMDEAVKKISELDMLSERISFIKAVLGRNAEAGRLRPEYAETIAAAESLNVRKNQLATAKNSVEAAGKNYAVVAEKGKAIAEGEKIYKTRLSEMAVLSGLSEVYDRIDAAEGKKSKISREIADVEKNCLLLASAFKNTGYEIEKLTSEQNEIQEKYALALPALLSRKSALEKGEEAEQNLLKYKKGLQKIEADIAALKNEAAVLENKKNTAEAEYEKLYTRFIVNTAAELSSSLKEGMPCPVCGSTEHPCPAQLSGDTVTSDDVKKAKQEYESACKALSDKINELNKQENRVPDAHKYIEEAAKIMEDCGYSADELKKVSEEAELAKEKNELLPQLRQKMSELLEHQNNLKNKSEDAVQRKMQLQSELSAANAEASALRNQLDKRYPDAVSYKAGLSALKDEIEKFEEEKTAFDEAMKTAEIRKIEASAALAQAEEEILAAQKNNENANRNFSFKISQAGFSSVEEYRKALLPDSTAAEYSNEAERYDLDRHALNERIGQLKTELEGKEKPDLELIKKEADDAQKNYSKKTTDYSIAKQRAEQLKKLNEDCSANFAETEKKREKYVKLASFADFMVGEKGISFTRYILGIILGLVVGEANSILAEVHGGKFRLCVKTELAANSKQGLDLEVETITDEGEAKYGVKDLSGGEKFLISLALSLGLSTVVQKRSGGIKIDAMFIDEGFGSLDTGLLREAVGILCGLTSDRNTIGIISHVSELKSIIPNGISVAKKNDGSSTILSTV